jgi:NADP-dependent 3-hydroxy acid dehydrogenase YdfG
VKELRGHNALVTGASGGIGTHIARALAGQGMNVVASGRREDALTALVDECAAREFRRRPFRLICLTSARSTR